MKYYSFSKSGIKAFGAWLTETREEINRDLFNL